jgi:hypothetical protein
MTPSLSNFENEGPVRRTFIFENRKSRGHHNVVIDLPIDQLPIEFCPSNARETV